MPPRPRRSPPVQSASLCSRGAHSRRARARGRAALREPGGPARAPGAGEPRAPAARARSRPDARSRGAHGPWSRSAARRWRRASGEASPRLPRAERAGPRFPRRSQGSPRLRPRPGAALARAAPTAAILQPVSCPGLCPGVLLPGAPYPGMRLAACTAPSRAVSRAVSRIAVRVPAFEPAGVGRTGIVMERSIGE
jgi:hypothetical protein